MFRKPGEDNYYKTRHVVKAKPISEKYAKILGKAYSQGKSSSRVHREYGKRQNLEEMVREEKTGTAEDQLRLFSRTLIKSSKIRRRDDESVDDIAEMQHIKQKVDDKDKRKYAEKQKRDSPCLSLIDRSGLLASLSLSQPP
uniref:Uncharacterized protein n=1 Tax=Heterorhabditis bacteriophora TaxID=37862 RepID=A0A1I7XAV4_HETBA